MSTENCTFIDFFAVNVDRSDVKPGIFKGVFICTDSWDDVTSINFNSKKSMKMKFSADKIYYNFSQEKASMNRTRKTNASAGTKKNYNAYKEFDQCEVEAHICASFMEFAGMNCMYNYIHK